MSSDPTSQPVPCPNCGTSAVAVLPAKSRIVDDENAADGKVQVDCSSCDVRFLVHYRTDPETGDARPDDAEPAGED